MSKLIIILKKNRKKIVEQFKLVTISWIGIFALDCLIELFLIGDRKTVTTAMGVEIKIQVGTHELWTEFALTWQTLTSYLLFLGVWLSVYFIFMFYRSYKKTQ